MNLVKKVRMFNLSAAALRTIGLILAVAGAAGLMIQRQMLGSGSVTGAQLLEALEAEPERMGYATMALIFQALEACAVPIFAFLLVEDARRTETIGRDLLIVLALASLCQLPYNLLATGSVWMLRGLNPVYALVMGLVMLYFFRRFPEKKGSHRAIKAIAIVFAFLWSNLLGVSHGAACEILTAVLWALKGKPNLQTFLGIATAICCSIFNLFYMLAPVSFLLLYFYEGEQGADNKRISCLIYPTCLLMDGFHVSYCTAKTVTYLYIGSMSAMNGDINLRRAVASAIDYETISNVLNKGHTKPVTCMIAPGINARPEDGTFTHAYTYDPEASRKFLAESNYQEADKLKVICVAGSKEETIGKVMANNLQEAGISTELAATDGATFMTLQAQGNFDICLYSTLPSLYDCNLIYQYWIPNSSGWDDNMYPGKETLGQLGVASLTEMDPEARTEIFRQMLSIINEDALFLPLYQDCNTFCYNERATGIEAIPGTNVRIDSWTWAD